MGLCQSCHKNGLPKLNENESLIKCTYVVKQFNETHIINNS